MDYFSSLVAQSISRARESTLSMLGITDKGLRESVARQMVDTLGAEGSFFAQPVFEHTFGWRQSDATLSKLAETLFSASLLNTLDKAKDYRFDPSMKPYTHQLKAWETLLAERPKSVVITSGTGSGKTECFMIPILEDLIREKERIKNPLVGVRALFLYPLNALINSQQERLDAWTKNFKQDIRFCLYNGKTKQDAYKVRKEQKDAPNQILSRELLRKEPAPILMTNATMLEYMLVRQEDHPILEISKQQQSLRWIVLDEAHTYVGSQAAEISLLLRRVVHAFGREPEQIRFVATSATIADAGTGANDKLQKYLADLAGVPKAQVVVIGGSRVIPDIPRIKKINNFSLGEISLIDAASEVSAQRFRQLNSSPIASRIRHEVVSSASPLGLNDLVIALDNLIAGTIAEKQKAVLKWLDLMTGTREKTDSAPYLKLRIHIFQRMLHGLWSCVNPTCEYKGVQLNNWPFGSVYVVQKVRCNCSAPVYEAAFCEDCKTPHLLAEDCSGRLQQRSVYTGDDFSLSYESTEEDESEVENGEHKKTHRIKSNEKVVLAPSNYEVNTYRSIALNPVTGNLGGTEENSLYINLAKELSASCVRCERENNHGKDFLRGKYLGAPFYVANAVPTVLEYCPDPDKEDLAGKSPEELPCRGRKLITFTDSRQGTARMAVKMQQDAERSRLRGLVFEILRNRQSKQDLEPKETASGSYEEILENAEMLKKIGKHRMAQELFKEAEQLKTGKVGTQPNIQLKWQDVVDELATSKDISQSILDYNKYVNPELFQGHEAGSTMARLLLAREFSRRPKNQNSTETLGIISVGYVGLNRIEEAPKFWGETKGVATTQELDESFLNLEDWIDFLKVALDYYVRENTFIRLDPTMQRWMGGRFTSKMLFSPTSETIESAVVRKWPQVRLQGNAHRLVKILEMVTGLDRKVQINSEKINHWLHSAWNDLVKVNILESFESGYSLNLNTLTFSLPQKAWICPVTHRFIDTTLRSITPYLSNKNILDNSRCRCIMLPSFTGLSSNGSDENKLSKIRQLIAEDTSVGELRAENLWTDISDRTVEGGFYYRTAEHSAQQSSEKLESYEAAFKLGKVNVLNCSTTMEMGVDIGGISAVVMNNVPPHPANYLQRAGRAGRRSESRAIAYTLCKADPHNQRVFAQPKWPFETAIPAPSITLSSDRIVQRHVNALFLAEFLKKETVTLTDRTKLSVQWFFSGDEESIYQRFRHWLATPSVELSKAVSTLVQGTALAGKSIASVVNDGLEILASINERWVEDFKRINEKILNATDEPYKRALNFELARHQGEYLLKDLSTRAFLPGHGFPSNIVNLNTYNIEDFIHKSSKSDSSSREDNVFTSKEQPTRGLDIALREYAPGAKVVIDGRVYRSAGVGLHWHSGGAIQEAQKFDIAWRCTDCGAAGVKENAYSNADNLRCSHCDAEIAKSQRRDVLRPSGFLTDFYEPTTNDISAQKFIRLERPRIQLEGESIALPDARCGFIRYGHTGSVFYSSSGENETGYAICMSCGRAESMGREGEVPPALKPDKSHRPIGGEAGSKKDKVCSGEFVKRGLFLGYQTPTDVLEVFMRSPKTGQWLTDSVDDQIIAMTLAVAIRDVIAEELGLASTEMGFGVRLDRDSISGVGRSVIQLYDQVSGGAGFVIAGVPEIVSVLKKTADRLSCPAKCDNVCSLCLAGNDSRVEMEELNRLAALEWIQASEVLLHLDLPAEFSHLPDVKYCAYSPMRFIRSLLNTGATNITVILGGNIDEWDLSHSTFRDSLITWRLVEKLEVNVVLPKDHPLPDDVKRSLSVLSQFGISIRESVHPELDRGVAMTAQICGDQETCSLLSNEADSGTPGASWLDSESAYLWATTKKLKRIDSTKVDVSEWDFRAAGATVIDFTNELNGTLGSLSQRVKNVFYERCPELLTLIENDKPLSISYTDRYLNSPWTLMLLAGFVKVFCHAGTEISINSVNNSSVRSGYLLNHDWKEAADQRAVISKWFKVISNIEPKLNFVNKAYEISHGRILDIQWASGKKSQLMFDQGMGYWRPLMSSKQEMQFDFFQSIDGQVQDMTYKAMAVNLSNSGSWPTFLTVLTV